MVVARAPRRFELRSEGREGASEPSLSRNSEVTEDFAIQGTQFGGGGDGSEVGELEGPCGVRRGPRLGLRILF